MRDPAVRDRGCVADTVRLMVVEAEGDSVAGAVAVFVAVGDRDLLRASVGVSEELGERLLDHVVVRDGETDREGVAVRE